MGMGMRVLLGHVNARLPQAYRDLTLPVTARRCRGTAGFLDRVPREVRRDGSHKALDSAPGTLC